MLPTNFAKLASNRPDLREAVEAIQSWCDGHRSKSVIDPRLLAQDVKLEPKLLTLALFYLVQQGILSQVYRFETPDGYLLSDDYKSFLDVPDELHDREERIVHRWEGEVVPVFRGQP